MVQTALFMHDHGRHHEIERGCGPVGLVEYSFEGVIICWQRNRAPQSVKHRLQNGALGGDVVESGKTNGGGVEESAWSVWRNSDESRRKDSLQPTAVFIRMAFEQDNTKWKTGRSHRAELGQPLLQYVRHGQSVVEHKKGWCIPSPIDQVGLVHEADCFITADKSGFPRKRRLVSIRWPCGCVQSSTQFQPKARFAHPSLAMKNPD